MLRNGPDKKDSTERQRTCWNAKKVLTFLLSVLTSDWLKQQKLTKLHKAVHIFILTFQPSSQFHITKSGLSLNDKEILCGEHVKLKTFLGYCFQLLLATAMVNKCSRRYGLSFCTLLSRRLGLGSLYQKNRRKSLYSSLKE